jgi:LAGLIDADG-like domain
MIGALSPLCVTPDTPVLLSDLSYIPAGDLRVGNELVGFDEYASPGERRKFKLSVVTACERKELECMEIETEDGLKTIASLDHPWLTRSGDSHSWSLTKNLHIGSRILSLGAPWTREDTWEAGYLAGVLDGEGSIRDGGHNSRVKFSQQKNACLDRTLAILNSRGIPYKLRENGAAARGYEPCYGVQLFGEDRKSGYSILNLLGAVRPPRLLNKQSRQVWSGRSVQIARDVRVVGLRFVGWREVAAFSTSTATFIANGMLMHNTRGDHKKRWWCERVQSLNSCPSPC